MMDETIFRLAELFTRSCWECDILQYHRRQRVHTPLEAMVDARNHMFDELVYGSLELRMM